MRHQPPIFKTRAAMIVALLAIPLLLVLLACRPKSTPAATPSAATPTATSLPSTGTSPTPPVALTPTLPRPQATATPTPTRPPTPTPVLLAEFRQVPPQWPSAWSREQRLQYVGGWMATLRFAPSRAVDKGMDYLEIGVDPRCPAPPIATERQVNFDCVMFGPPVPGSGPFFEPHLWYPDNFVGGGLDMKRLTTGLVPPTKQVEWAVRASFPEDLTVSLTWESTLLPAGMTLSLVDSATGQTLGDLTKPGKVDLSFSRAKPDVALAVRAAGADMPAPTALRLPGGNTQ